jgi:hypothetical protein
MYCSVSFSVPYRCVPLLRVIITQFALVSTIVTVSCGSIIHSDCFSTLRLKSCITHSLVAISAWLVSVHTAAKSVPCQRVTNRPCIVQRELVSCTEKVIPGIRRFCLRLSPQKRTFDFRPVHGVFLMDQVALGTGFPPSTSVFPCTVSLHKCSARTSHSCTIDAVYS